MNEMYCTQCGHDPLLQADNDRRNMEELEAARARIAELEAARRWVPVVEKFPDRAKRVLVFTETFSQHTAWLDWVNRDNEPLFVYYEAVGKMVYLDSVTHWQPLPAAPEAANES